MCFVGPMQLPSLYFYLFDFLQEGRNLDLKNNFIRQHNFILYNTSTIILKFECIFLFELFSNCYFFFNVQIDCFCHFKVAFL